MILPDLPEDETLEIVHRVGNFQSAIYILVKLFLHTKVEVSSTKLACELFARLPGFVNKTYT